MKDSGLVNWIWREYRNVPLMIHSKFLNYDKQLRGTRRHNRCLHSDFTTWLQMAPPKAKYIEEDFEYAHSLGRQSTGWNQAGLENKHFA